jgi:hypothetical protein
MITINQFSKEFYDRHNFNCDDDDFLPNKYKHIRFSNIPEAWICKIDSFLEKMDLPEKIKSITQTHGFLSIDIDTENQKDIKLLQKLDNCLMSIDIDLINQIEQSKILH